VPDPRLHEDDLIAMLSQTLGDAKAREVLSAAMVALGVRRGVLTPALALEVLEHIAIEPGIVGMTARFAKSRVHLGARAKRVG
jgi:hypothetical protein